jgi:hypothetical protein
MVDNDHRSRRMQLVCRLWARPEASLGCCCYQQLAVGWHATLATVEKTPLSFFWQLEEFKFLKMRLKVVYVYWAGCTIVALALSFVFC